MKTEDVNNVDNDEHNEIVTVKIHTQSTDDETLTRVFGLSTTVGSLRSYLHQLLDNVDRTEIVLKHNDETLLEDDRSLKQLGATPLGTFELDLRTKGGAGGVRLATAAEFSRCLPAAVDVLTVRVNKKTIVVEIENCCAAVKPWLGGYRDRCTGRVYHNASVQTDYRTPKVRGQRAAADRSIQTAVDKAMGHATTDRGVQTGDDVGSSSTAKVTAARRPCVPDEPDGRRVGRELPSPSHEDRAVVKSVVVIQRAFRRVLERRNRVRPVDRAQCSRPTTAAAASRSTVTELESKQQRYNALYAMIGRWWKRERQRIRDAAAAAAEDNAVRRAARMNLLKKEIEFLMEVEKQRVELKYELTKHDDTTFLNKTSKPKMFRNKNGKLLTVDTVGNQKARELRDVYARVVTRPPEHADDRLQSLDDLYALVSASGYKYKRDLMDAIDMEKGLTAAMGGVRAHAGLRSIRSRIEQLFRHMIRQPEVNPEVDSYYRPTEKRILNVYTCIRCKRNLAATDFSLESRVNRTNVCAGCEWAEQVGHKRIDMAPYRRILKTLRHDETQMAAYHSECFLMQPTEVYRLVTVIWEEKSAISETGQLSALRLVRWRREHRWSPWNCVLLTKEEAKVHLEIGDRLEDYYDTKFISWVQNKHLTAKLQFANLVQVVKNQGEKKCKGLTKNWQVVADNFNIRV